MLRQCASALGGGSEGQPARMQLCGQRQAATIGVIQMSPLHNSAVGSSRSESARPARCRGTIASRANRSRNRSRRDDCSGPEVGGRCRRESNSAVDAARLERLGFCIAGLKQPSASGGETTEAVAKALRGPSSRESRSRVVARSVPARLDVGDRDGAPGLLGGRFRASTITCCMGTGRAEGRCDLDHAAVAWPGVAVISSLPAHALLPIVRWGSDRRRSFRRHPHVGIAHLAESVAAECGVLEPDFCKRYEEKPRYSSV